MLPTVVVGVAFTALLGPGAPLAWLSLDQSFLIIVLALAFFNVTVVARTVGGFWAQLDGRAEQAARMLGASPARAFATAWSPIALCCFQNATISCANSGVTCFQTG